MNYIKQDIIEKIYDAADIVEVVGEFVDLKKSGVNYKDYAPSIKTTLHHCRFHRHAKSSSVLLVARAAMPLPS